jgi:preprotein translocase subunit SecF
MKSWNIIGKRRYGYLLSAAVMVPGLIALAVWGINFGIDFTGGTLLDVRLARDASVEEVRGVMSGFGQAEAVIQQSRERPREFIIRTESLDEATTARVTAALGRQFGGVEVLLAERVGPKIGRELRNRALLAVSVGLLLQVLYITWRFRSGRFAVAADVALLHDLIVVLGLYALTRKQVDSSFVAVLLTVIGYSINDTVVIFDRIRETMGQRIRASFPELVNRSILEVLVRSLTTGAGALMALAAIYFLGGVTIRDFAFGLTIGVLTGTYSSIFVASPLLVEWHNWSERRAGRRPEAPRDVEPVREAVSVPSGGPRPAGSRSGGTRPGRRRNRR